MQEVEAGVRQLFSPVGTQRTVYPIFQGLVSADLNSLREPLPSVISSMVRATEEDGIHHKLDERFCEVPAKLLARERPDGTKEVNIITKNGFQIQLISVKGVDDGFIYVNEFTKKHTG